MEIHLQYISDGSGKTTGVFIPISDWKKLKQRFKGIEDVATEDPEWHKHVVRERMADYRANPDQAQGFNEAMDDLDRQE
jgi:hypothetical protein